MFNDVQNLIALEKTYLAYNKQKLIEMKQIIFRFNYHLYALAKYEEKSKRKGNELEKRVSDVKSVIDLCKKQIPQVKKDINKCKKCISQLYYFFQEKGE